MEGAVAVADVVLVPLVVDALAAVDAVVVVDPEVRWSYGDIYGVLLCTVNFLLTNIFYGVLKFLIFK